MSIIIGKIVIEWPRSRRYFIAITPLVYSTGILAIVILPNNNMPADINAWDYVVIVLFFLTISASFAVLYTVLCSAISLLSDSKRLGTAWGVLGTAIGLGESVGPIINVFVLDIGRTLR